MSPSPRPPEPVAAEPVRAGPVPLGPVDPWPETSQPVCLDAVSDPGAALDAAYSSGGLIRLTTSGTAGRPRHVLRTAASWMDSFAPAADLAGLTASSRVFVPGPRQATMNLYALLMARHVGAGPVSHVNDATHVFLTPAALADLLDRAEPERGRAAAPHAVVAGDRLSPHLADRAQQAGWRVSHYYGAAQLSFVAWGRDADSLRPFPGVTVRARDGQLWVRSPWVCCAEEAPPGQPAALRRDGEWAGVGDRGAVTADGRVVVGGREEILLCGGRTVYPGDVEATLREAARGDVYVVGVPHALLGSVTAAVCTDPRDLPEVRAVARRILSGADRPRRWLCCPAPPVTTGGKVDRGRLADWAAGRRGGRA